jgi:flavin-dependent dehydrogenase
LLSKKFKDIEEFQQKVIYKNKFLKSIFEESESMFNTALTIGQISFESKAPVENHILMCGDSAGMIHPLCGNGMSMAIRSSQIASEIIIDYLHKKIVSRQLLEKAYIKSWNNNFRSRLKVGHVVANLFRNNRMTDTSISILKLIPSLIPAIIKQTHGKPMIVK